MKIQGGAPLTAPPLNTPLAVLNYHVSYRLLGSKLETLIFVNFHLNSLIFIITIMYE